MTKNIFVGIFMPALVFSILSYTCYQYLFNVLDLHYNNTTQRWLTSRGSVSNAAITLVLYISSIASYFTLMIKTSNPIPINKDKNQTDLDTAYKFPEVYFSPESNSTIIALSLAGEKGHSLYCEKCKSNKPERAHHCKQCNRCAPKMDHHCVWINGCVDEENYKQFFLFVLYVPLYCISIELKLLPLLLNSIKKEIGTITLEFCWKVYKVYIASIYHFWKNVMFMIWHRSWMPLLSGVQSIGLESISLHWYALTVLGFLFGLTLTGFAAVHFWYIVTNQTSIECIANRPIHVRADFDKSGKNYEVITVTDSRRMYDLGPLENWYSIMGQNPLFWFVPFTRYTGNSHQRVYPYHLQFSKEIIDLAKAQRKNRLKEN